MMGGGWVQLDYNVSSGPFLSSELIIGPGPGPGPELDNIMGVGGICELTNNYYIPGRFTFSQCCTEHREYNTT